MRSFVGLLILGGCAAESLPVPALELAGPEVVGANLSTDLHHPQNGKLFARLRAKRFAGDRDGRSQSLEDVRVELIHMKVRLQSQRAELSGRNLQLRGKVKGKMPDGRRFTTPRLDYFSGPGIVRLAGPAVFSGRGHSLVAEGGAVVDDDFESLELRGPVRGRIQTQR